MSSFCNATYGQPAVEWYNSTDVGEAGAYSHAELADWIFDIIQTEEGNYLAVGFGLDDEAGTSHERVPSFVLYGPNGHLLQDKVVGEETGQFIGVTEGESYYYAVGYQADKALLVRIHKDDLSYDAYPVTTGKFISSENDRSARLQDVIELECSGTKRIFSLGYATEEGEDKERSRWIAAFEIDGNGDISIVDEWVSASSSLQEEMYGFVVDPQPNGTFLFYTLSQIQKVKESDPNLRRDDLDIRVQKFTYDCSSGFTPGASEDFNSIPWATRDLSDLSGNPPTGTILRDYPPVFQDEYPYGPKYLGAPLLERDFDNCNESSPTLGLYIEDWADASGDIAYDLVLTDDEIVVSALLNRLEMWGANVNLGGDAGEGLRCESSPCHDFDSHSYLWGECYLLFVDQDDLDLNHASHLGTLSGGDFRPRLVQTTDDGFAVVGTISGCMDGQTEPVEGFETFLVIKTDDSGNVEWRKSIKGPEEGSCGFAIANTNDGGLIVGGNLADIDGEDEEENYLIVKLGPEPCEFSGDVVEANYFDNYYVVTGNETWDSDLTVTARVAVMPGAELTIEGSPSSPITIHFADSEERSGFDERSPIGIRVLAGGKMTVENAKLTGTECNGITRMWDGISVEGNPNQEQNNTYQGYCSLENTVIENARFGLAASEVWMKQEEWTDESTGGESAGVLSKASLTTGAKGGARIATLNSEFLNNYRGVHFAQYLYEPNVSAFYFTDFTSNGPLVDPDLALRPVDTESSFDNNEPRGTYIHASIWGTRVRFLSCNFSGSTGIIPHFRPRGIEGDEPQIVVGAGTIKDLKRGVECRNLTGGMLANVDLKNVDFDNIPEGVLLRGSAFDIVSFCDFTNIPLQAGFGTQEPYGIFAENAKGGLFYGNSFSGPDSEGESYGLVVLNSKDDGALETENRFESIRYGNQFLGNNGFLTAKCNDYEDIGLSAWTVIPKGGVGDLMNQGQSGSSTPKADNQFFDACDFEETGYSHIYSDGVVFEYHDKTGNAYPVEEDCVTDPPVDLDVVVDGTPIDCDPEVPFTTPCSEAVSYTPSTPLPPCDRLADFTGSDKSLEERNKAIRGLLHPGVDSLDNLLPPNFEDALEVLEIRNQSEDIALRIGTLTGLGRYSEAEALLDSLPDAFEEYSTYRDYIEIFIQAETPADSLSGEDYQSALAAVEEEDTYAQILAQNLRFFQEQIFTPVHPVLVDELDIRSPKQSLPPSGQKSVSEKIVYPNPFTHTLTFDLQGLEAGALYRVSVYDAMERLEWASQSKGGTLLVWRAENLKPGVYFYIIEKEGEGKAVQRGKAIKF